MNEPLCDAIKGTGSSARLVKLLQKAVKLSTKYGLLRVFYLLLCVQGQGPQRESGKKNNDKKIRVNIFNRSSNNPA